MDTVRYMKGLYIIGKLSEFNDGETVAFFLTPEGQALIRETFMEHARRANENDIETGGIGDAYDGEAAFKRLDDLVRYRLQQEIEQVAVEIEKEEKTRIQEAHERRHRPHEAGTTAEIAAKLGISKSEARKLKREGNLDAALAALKSTGSE